MKLLKNVFLLSLLTLFITSCDKQDGYLASNLDDVTLDARGSNEMITVPFKVQYVGDYTYVGPNEERCGEFPPYVNVVVDGTGTGTHVGRSTIHFDFCVDGRDNTYGDTKAYIVAANGDMLNISIEGQVLPGRTEDHPEFVTSYWKDPFVILGGTGRFEGASGSGISDDYNSSEDPNSHHNWTGTITMKKGKR